jgi:hypothetical protein
MERAITPSALLLRGVPAKPQTPRRTDVEIATAFVLYVHLGPDEWGSAKMNQAARQAFDDPEYAEYRPLVVVVHEHDGRSLTYAVVEGELTRVGSSNPAAVYPPGVAAFREALRSARQVVVGTVRRGDPD